MANKGSFGQATSSSCAVGRTSSPRSWARCWADQMCPRRRKPPGGSSPRPCSTPCGQPTWSASRVRAIRIAPTSTARCSGCSASSTTPHARPWTSKGWAKQRRPNSWAATASSPITADLYSRWTVPQLTPAWAALPSYPGRQPRRRHRRRPPAQPLSRLLASSLGIRPLGPTGARAAGPGVWATLDALMAAQPARSLPPVDGIGPIIAASVKPEFLALPAIQAVLERLRAAGGDRRRRPAPRPVEGAVGPPMGQAAPPVRQPSVGRPDDRGDGRRATAIAQGGGRGGHCGPRREILARRVEEDFPLSSSADAPGASKLQRPRELGIRMVPAEAFEALLEIRLPARIGVGGQLASVHRTAGPNRSVAYECPDAPYL